MRILKNGLIAVTAIPLLFFGWGLCLFFYYQLVTSLVDAFWPRASMGVIFWAGALPILAFVVWCIYPIYKAFADAAQQDGVGKEVEL